MKEVKVESILLIINENIEDTEITAEQSDEDLSELGMDSITFIRVVVALEEVYDIEIPEEYLLITEMDTVNKMLGVVSDAVNNADR